MTPKLSVIIPCHNPRPHYLARVIESLRRQTLPREDWDLVVVDNASTPPLTEGPPSSLDLSWHPSGRLVREEVLGLTPARARGISATSGALLVFVDDDNVLAADYLEQAAAIAREKPFLGTFSGLVTPEFETPPPPWTRPYWEMLGIRETPASVWSNDINHWASTPIGAGLCVRRDVATSYVEKLKQSPLRSALDRRGASLVSGGDNDLAYLGVAMGYGMGVFRELRLTHLIPSERLSAEYLYRLSEAIGYSAVLLDALWKREGFTESGFPSAGRLIRRGWELLRDRWRQRRYVAARRHGIARGRAVLSALSAHTLGGGEPPRDSNPGRKVAPP